MCHNLWQRISLAEPKFSVLQRRQMSVVLRVPKESIPKIAIRWTPPGRRKPGRSKTTRCKTVMAELQDMGLSWGEAQATAKDRTLWRNIVVVALCHSGDKEDK